jgi:tetratricopeptide (TPR) repeat protein
MKYNDSEVVKNALYDLITLDPSDDSLKLNLCYLYFENSQFASSLFCSADLLAKNSDNINALRVNAASLENMGALDKAAEKYESLYLKTNEIMVLYQLAFIQYELKRHTECKTNLDIIIKNAQAKEQKLTFPLGDTGQQQISLDAVAYNLSGMNELQQGNKSEAKKQFEKALEIAPEFQLAKKNLKDAE